jgi:hypothetical protein
LFHILLQLLARCSGVLEAIADKRLCETPLKVAFNVAVPTGLLVLPTASADEQNRAQAVTRVQIVGLHNNGGALRRVFIRRRIPH